MWLVQIATVHPPTSASRIQICADSWRAEQMKYAAINFAGSLRSVFPGKHRETMGIMGITSERGTGSTTLCNWFSKPESSEIAEHMELNRAALPSRGSYNPLPILQQIQPPLVPSWQTRGAETDRLLIKTSAYRYDSTLLPVCASDWFYSQVSQWAVPRVSASKLEEQHSSALIRRLFTLKWPLFLRLPHQWVQFIGFGPVAPWHLTSLLQWR